MRKSIVILIALVLPGTLFASTPNFILPNPFPVYTDGQAVINHPAPGFMRRNLPTNNDYRGDPGCYITCYSHQKKHAIYSVTKDIYVHGQIRVPGRYVNRICIPIDFEGRDISASHYFKNLCAAKIKNCRGCWAGGDTGGWFGIQ